MAGADAVLDDIRVALRSAVLLLIAACSAGPDEPSGAPAPVIQSLSPTTAAPGAGPIIHSRAGWRW